MRSMSISFQRLAQTIVLLLILISLQEGHDYTELIGDFYAQFSIYQHATRFAERLGLCRPGEYSWAN